MNFRVIKLTLPIVRTVLLKNRRAIVVIALLSIMSGILPTLKSELEAGLIQEVSLAVSPPSSFRPPVSLDKRLDRFSVPNSDTDFEVGVANVLFANLTLASSIFVYALLVLFTFVVANSSNKLVSKIGAEVFSFLRDVGLRRGLLTDPIDLPSLPNVAGQFASALQQGAKNISATYSYMLEIGQNIFSIATTLFIVAIKSPGFAVFCILVVSAQGMVSLHQARSLEAERNKLDETRNDLVARTDDILSKRDVIVANEQQNKFSSKIRAMTIIFSSVEQNLRVRENRFDLLSELISDYGRFFFVASVLLFIIYTQPRTISEIGDIYFLITIYSRLLVSTSGVLNRYDDIKKSEATSKAFLEILDDERLLKRLVSGGLPAQKKKDSRDAAIVFDDVSFKYDQDHIVLNNCSFVVPSGGMTLMVGKSGSGKTTIARAILGFWPISSGSIYVQQQEISVLGKDKVREKISYVSQGDHIIDDTIRENLSWIQSKEVPDIDMLDVMCAVGIKGAKDPSILDKPAKKMSLGQQQRLSIARLLLDDSPIVIADEPLTGVDVFTMRDIIPALRKFFNEPNKTVLVFSHNLALTAYAHHVVVLGDEGKVAEEGEPHRLLSKNDGVFSKIYKTARDGFDIS